jgi:formylglycine-generating enzyme required for sulfatase activity
VVNVTWQDAAQYCNWLSQQEGLPLAYQPQGGNLALVCRRRRAIACRRRPSGSGPHASNRDGTLRKYPWGDALPVPGGAGNFGDRRAQPLLQTFSPNSTTATPPRPARRIVCGANPLGLHDLGGNVAEWTTDLYGVQPASSAAVVTDPIAAAAGNLHVIRGSSWRHATVTELRAAYRDSWQRPTRRRRLQDCTLCRIEK